MTPTADALRRLRWSIRALASECGCDHSLARRWASGDAPTPAPVADWLAQRIAAVEALPCPAWRVGPGRRKAQERHTAPAAHLP